MTLIGAIEGPLCGGVAAEVYVCHHIVGGIWVGENLLAGGMLLEVRNESGQVLWSRLPGSLSALLTGTYTPHNTPMSDRVDVARNAPARMDNLEEPDLLGDTPEESAVGELPKATH